jgi:NAD(P)-dependent dehydrogenase (short-subunit alcohol dehydrogenase family)
MRTALITGAADGIGWATAQAFAAAGYRVAIADLREGQAVERAAELGVLHPLAHVAHLGLACDVTNETAVASAVASVHAAFGVIDVLVNNAGIGDQPGATVDQKLDAFDRVLGVHLRGTFLMSREVARLMLMQTPDARGNRGAIVNIASIVASAGIPGRNAYGAAKAGIVGMSKAMAVEWGLQGLRVNAVAPGYVRTALVEKLQGQGLLNTEAIHQRTPMGRMGLPSEIADAIVFLASPQASFVTGSVLQVDGGWVAHGGAIPSVPPVVAS